MAMTLLRPATKSRLVAEAQMEAERMRDVQLLLDHLLRQEEVTIRFILDCLYDVASVNLINQKVRSQPLNQLTRAIAVMSKPVFKPFALRWINKNCSRLITNWLYRKVRFNTPKTQPAVMVNQVIEAQATLAPALEHDRQIQQLQRQVRWLTGLLVGVVLLWGGSIALPYYSNSSGSAQPQEKVLQENVQQP